MEMFSKKAGAKGGVGKPVGVKPSRMFLIICGGVMLLLVVIGLCLIKLVVGDVQMKGKRQVAMVRVMQQPPPRPKIPEKLPEPEIKKENKQEFVKFDDRLMPPQESRNEPPPKGGLGVDAEGGAGSDAFGLVGNRGGASLIGGVSATGSGGGGSPMRKYGWYTQIIENDIRREVMQLLTEGGGAIPKGKLRTEIKLTLNRRGSVMSFSILASSGNGKVDEAIRKALAKTTISQPPPEGMPLTIGLRIMSEG